MDKCKFEEFIKWMHESGTMKQIAETLAVCERAIGASEKAKYECVKLRIVEDVDDIESEFCNKFADLIFEPIYDAVISELAMRVVKEVNPMIADINKGKPTDNFGEFINAITSAVNELEEIKKVIMENTSKEGEK